MKTALAQVIVYVFVWSNLSVQCFVAYEVHCYTLLYTRACIVTYTYAHAVILTAYQRSFLSPYRAFTYSSYIFRSTFHWLSNGTGFGPRNGGGQKCTKLDPAPLIQYSPSPAHTRQTINRRILRRASAVSSS